MFHIIQLKNNYFNVKTLPNTKYSFYLNSRFHNQETASTSFTLLLQVFDIGALGSRS